MCSNQKIGLLWRNHKRVSMLNTATKNPGSNIVPTGVLQIAPGHVKRVYIFSINT